MASTCSGDLGFVVAEPGGVAERRAALGKVAQAVDPASDDLAARVPNVADGIDHDERGYDHIPELRRPRTQPRGNHVFEPGGLAARGAAAHAHAPLGEVGGRVVARPICIVGAGPTQRLPSIAEIEDDGRWNDGNRPRIPNL